jgi:IS5 family transposase
LVKNTWGHTKVRYQGLNKNSCQLFTVFALANLLMARYLLKGDDGNYLLS